MMGKFVMIDSGSTMTTEQIVERIIKNRLEYEERNLKKEKKEKAVFEAIQKSQKTAEKSG
jgi:ethanolamine-phosphate cytidylyltransferase